MFPYKPGDKFQRSEMHEIVGGSFRHGMTSCSQGEEFLLFHDSKKSRKFGYDVWEGPRPDGSFKYSGQGTVGDQELTKANAGLISAHENLKPIHLIESADGECTYLGRFILGDPYYEEKQVHDVSGFNLRRMYVFNLLPIEVSGTNLILSDLQGITRFEKEWVPPESSDLERDRVPIMKNTILRVENKLQTEFGYFLIDNGYEPKRLEFSFPDNRGILKPDFWVPDLNLVVEAKPSIFREYVRLAIGQVLDYQNLGLRSGVSMQAGILLPSLPSPDLVELISKLKIHLIYRSESTFMLDGSPPPWQLDSFGSNP